MIYREANVDLFSLIPLYFYDYSVACAMHLMDCVENHAKGGSNGYNMKADVDACYGRISMLAAHSCEQHSRALMIIFYSLLIITCELGLCGDAPPCNKFMLLPYFDLGFANTGLTKPSLAIKELLLQINNDNADQVVQWIIAQLKDLIKVLKEDICANQHMQHQPPGVVATNTPNQSGAPWVDMTKIEMTFPKALPMDTVWKLEPLKKEAAKKQLRPESETCAAQVSVPNASKVDQQAPTIGYIATKLQAGVLASASPMKKAAAKKTSAPTKKTSPKRTAATKSKKKSIKIAKKAPARKSPRLMTAP